MYTPFKMKGKSPMMKALIGKQNNLPQELKAKIMAAPESPAKKSIRQQQIEGTYVSPKDRPKKVVVKKEKKVSVRKQQILDAEKKRLKDRKGNSKKELLLLKRKKKLKLKKLKLKLQRQE